MEGDEQVRVGRKPQQREVLEAVPVRRPDHDDPRRIGLPDDRQLLCEQPVPDVAVQLVVRFVQQFEGDIARRIGEAWRDLPPECGQLRPADIERILEQELKSCSSTITPRPAFSASRTTSSSFASQAESSRFARP